MHRVCVARPRGRGASSRVLIRDGALAVAGHGALANDLGAPAGVSRTASETARVNPPALDSAQSARKRGPTSYLELGAGPPVPARPPVIRSASGVI